MFLIVFLLHNIIYSKIIGNNPVCFIISFFCHRFRLLPEVLHMPVYQLCHPFRPLRVVDNQCPLAGLCIVCHLCGPLSVATCYMVSIRVILALMERAAPNRRRREHFSLGKNVLSPRLLIRRRLSFNPCDSPMKCRWLWHLPVRLHFASTGTLRCRTGSLLHSRFRGLLQAVFLQYGY